MNLFKREMKSTYKSLIVWTVASLVLTYISYWEYGLSDSADQMSDLFAGFPDIINTLFGVSPLGVNDVVGYAALIIYYITFIGLAYALILGSKMVQKELDDKTSEFLFTKPIGRTKVLKVKTAVAKLDMFIFILFNYLLTVVMMINVSDPAYTDSEIIKYITLTYFGLYLLMVVTYLITVAANSVFSNKVMSLSIGGLFIMYSYATAVIILSFEKLNDLTIISPWRYFALDVIVNDGFNFVYLIILIGLSVISYGIAYKAIKTKTF